MTVNFEFLSDEPIENVITCINYRVDKVVCFGSEEKIERFESITETFLKKYCDVKDVRFYPISEDPLWEIESVIINELRDGNRLFFDVTGGESVPLITIGKLSAEYELPMHEFDIESNTLKEYDTDSDRLLSSCAEKRRVDLTLEKYISLYGAAINKDLDKFSGYLKDETALDYINRIYEVMIAHGEVWNSFINYLSSVLMKCCDGLRISRGYQAVLDDMKEDIYSGLGKARELNSILDELEEEGIVRDVRNTNGKFSFCFTDELSRELLLTGGHILEFKYYEKQKKVSDHCMCSVHIDWDGVIHDTSLDDVINEIDVLSITGNIPTFISCKSGRLDRYTVLGALYELDMISSRFGGKYAKRKLVKIAECKPIFIERAIEMGIDIETME